jgi:hypothetical protein
MFREDKSLPIEYKMHVSAKLDAIYQAMYQNTKEGDKIVFKEAGPHWFLDRINNAKKLETEKVYTVKEISVASSSTGVALEETGDLMYELGWFETLEN